MRILGTLNDSPEWYTPAHVIVLAKRLMGDIDLDPASSHEAQKLVQAQAYYTKEHDGLAERWFGRIFLNPPYGSSNGQPLWAKKLEQEYLAGNVSQALLLVNANLGYNWFNHLLYTYPTCLLRDRLSFIPGSGQKATLSRRASALVYFGSNGWLFKQLTQPLGIVVLAGGHVQ